MRRILPLLLVLICIPAKSEKKEDLKEEVTTRVDTVFESINEFDSQKISPDTHLWMRLTGFSEIKQNFTIIGVKFAVMPEVEIHMKKKP